MSPASIRVRPASSGSRPTSDCSRLSRSAGAKGSPVRRRRLAAAVHWRPPSTGPVVDRPSRKGRRMRRIAIITGGASGIGAAIGRALVVRGHDVVLADVQHDAAERLAEQLTAAGPGAARGVLLDVRAGDQVVDLVRDVHAAHERLDLMFNNAGVDVSGEPEELSLAHWERAIDVNLRGVLHGCRAAYPLMKAQPQGGYIINTASLAGLMPISGGTAPYAMTKSGVVGLSLALRAAGRTSE